MIEIYKPIKNYEDTYMVSNFGNVKNYKTERILKPFFNNHGYRYIELSKHNKPKKFRICRLVAQHFIKNTGNLDCVNHIDSNRQNDMVSNLEWCSYKENYLHMNRVQLIRNIEVELIISPQLRGEYIRGQISTLTFIRSLKERNDNG